MSTTRLSHITILKEDNFADWIIDVRAHLRQKRLWKYTQEAAPKDDTKSDWEEKAQEAADFITPTISPAIKLKLTEAEFNDGYQMVTRLTALLAPKGDAQFMRLTKEYYTLRAEDFKDIEEFLTHVKILEEQIDATNTELTNDKRTLLCLSMALPPQYRTLVQIWSLQPDITADKARDMLLEEHRRDKEVEKDSGMRAFYGGFGKQKRPGNTTSERGKNCARCNKPGHTIDQCWEEHPELAPEWIKKKNSRSGLARFHDHDDQSQDFGGGIAL